MWLLEMQAHIEGTEVSRQCDGKDVDGPIGGEGGGGSEGGAAGGKGGEGDGGGGGGGSDGDGGSSGGVETLSCALQMPRSQTVPYEFRWLGCG